MKLSKWLRSFYDKGCAFLSTFFIFSLLSFSIHSQTFELIFKSTLDDVSEDALELNDGSFILLMNSGDFYEEDYQAKLIKLSNEGIIVDSADLAIPEDYKLNFLFDLFNVNDTLVAIGRCKSMLTDSSCYIIYHFNSNLEIFGSYLSNFSFPEIYVIGNLIVTSDNNIISIGTDWTEYNQFLFKFGLCGNLIDSAYFIDENFSPRFANAVMEIEELNVLHFYLSGFPQDFWVVDKQSLEIDTVLDYNDSIWIWDCHTGLTDSTYFVIGRNYIGNGIVKPAFLEVDKFGSVNSIQSYNFIADTNSANLEKSLDTYNHKIFLVAAHNAYAAGFPFGQQQQWLWLMRINQDYSVEWQHFYKGEVNYMPNKIIATKDGGALIVSTKYDWNDPIPDQRDVHILKIDSTGYYDPITGTEEEPVQTNKQILVYPNPAMNELNFVLGLYSNLQLSIYNSTGERMIFKSLPHSQTIDISTLPPGIYVYLLTGKNGFTETGKIIKE